MARLTKADIEKALLAGKPVAWRDQLGKSATIVLDAAKQRRLLNYLLTSNVRVVKNLPSSVADGLAAAYSGVGDPAASGAASTAAFAAGGPWKIQSVRVEGFGGVNSWKGKPFDLSLDGESLLVDGPNGSGKSSLTGAITWGLTGERPRDQDEHPGDELRPVFDADDKEAGHWPPVATYPTELLDLKTVPFVQVEITFSNHAGVTAKVRRTLDGRKVTHSADPPELHIPSILLEAGLLMPVRLPKLRLSDGRGRLTDAVQKLTGLDDLVELGTFVQGLCHKGRDYLSYMSTELETALGAFDNQIEIARSALASVSTPVPTFKVSDTDDATSEMAVLGKTLNAKAASLTKTVSADLASGLDLNDPLVQRRLGVALATAEQEVTAGLEGFAVWKTLSAVQSALTAEVRGRLREAIISGEKSLASALDFNKKQEADNRYRLKAAGAQWHAEHLADASITDCPLCAQELSSKPELRKELEELQLAGEAATRRLADNVNAISIQLEQSVPYALRRYLSDSLPGTPRTTLLLEIRAKLVTADRYTNYLKMFATLVEAACASAPTHELPVKMPANATDWAPETAHIQQRLAKVEMMCAAAEWFENQRGAWKSWWEDFAISKQSLDASTSENGRETLTAHLTRLGKSLGEAEPYRVGAEAMRKAWKEGKIAAKIEAERARRSEIAEALAPLKNLGNLAEAQARTAINELSDRISAIHSEIYIADTLQFQKTSLEKKTGLVVRGKFSNEIRIDATLVANTSWLRGVLWAFIFALREEAVEQLGQDVFPVMLLDDPQQTFDSEHRHRWAEQIARLQKNSPGVQVLLTSHDERFLSLLDLDGVAGRHALLSTATPELGHIGLFEGTALDRRWALVQKSKTPAVAKEYMAAVREFVEGLLKLMLRGEDVDVQGSVLGSCRDKINTLHKAGHEPWSRAAFANLAGALGKGIPEIKFIELAHHADGAHLGMGEAADVEKYWRKSLRPTLERAFRIVRDHRALHGGLTALHAMPPTVALPEGYKAVVRASKLPLIGTAAAMTGGRVADGCMNVAIDESSREVVELKDHVIFRITRPTLEPVARPGDLLLVSEHASPSAKSFVIAMNEDRILARRLEIADNHSDVAVLTANAINPRMIAPPIVAKLSTLTLRKIVGVIFDHNKTLLSQHGEMEVCECGGEAAVKAALAGMLGLVEVSGHSAEPHALDKQFLIVCHPVSFDEADDRWDGSPMIAEDSNGGRYFKRYRRGRNVIILESLEIGGGFAPIVLAEKAGSAPFVQTLWPVLGVLFERPK